MLKFHKTPQKLRILNEDKRNFTTMVDKWTYYYTKYGMSEIM